MEAAEVMTYIIQAVQWILMGLIAIICYGLRDRFTKTDASIEYIKENYVKKDYLKLNIDHIKETIAASEKRIIDKMDFLVSTFKK